MVTQLRSLNNISALTVMSALACVHSLFRAVRDETLSVKAL